jgi:hypothetical protein
MKSFFQKVSPRAFYVNYTLYTCIYILYCSNLLIYFTYYIITSITLFSTENIYEVTYISTLTTIPQISVIRGPRTSLLYVLTLIQTPFTLVHTHLSLYNCFYPFTLEFHHVPPFAFALERTS